MASLRKCASWVLDEARDGIAWIAVWHEGRGWRSEAFFPEEFDYSNGRMELSEDDYSRIQEILDADTEAIFVNGYYSNLGLTEDMTLDSLTAALRWQYEDCQPLLKNWEMEVA
jgi:hypothetical protein